MAVGVANKACLSKGQKFTVIPGTRLFVNDNYQGGIWIEEQFNDGTKHLGQIVSGALDTSHPVQIIDLWTAYESGIVIRVRQLGGWHEHGGSEGFKDAGIEMSLFQQFFQPAS